MSSLTVRGRGAAFGDVDNDGDVDILVSNNNGPLRLLRDDTGASRNWFEARLIGTTSNRMAIGARLALYRRAGPPLWRHVDTASSYLRSSDSRAHFGIGNHTDIDRVEAHWPSGLVEMWPNPPLNRVAALAEGSGSPAAGSTSKFGKGRCLADTSRRRRPRVRRIEAEPSRSA